MAEVRVIAKFAARKGKEKQLRELLRGMLAPTHAESGCKTYDLYESDSKGSLLFLRNLGEPSSSQSTRSQFSLQALGAERRGNITGAL